FLLESPSPCDDAAGVLERLGPAAAPAVDALGKMLQQGAACHRIAAAKALAAIGKKAQPAIALLRNAALDDRDEYHCMQGPAAQKAAQLALQKILHEVDVH